MPLCAFNGHTRRAKECTDTTKQRTDTCGVCSMVTARMTTPNATEALADAFLGVPLKPPQTVGWRRSTALPSAVFCDHCALLVSTATLTAFPTVRVQSYHTQCPKNVLTPPNDAPALVGIVQ